jgi:hypothetical protein
MAAPLRDELHIIVTDCGDGTWEWEICGQGEPLAARMRDGPFKSQDSPLRLTKAHFGNFWSFWNSDRKTMPELRRSTSGGNGVLEMTNENFARLLRGLTIAVGNRKNRILFYQFLKAEIRALHYSYGIGDGESYKRALSFLEDCERLTLRSLMRKSAEHRVEVTVDHARRVFSRALKKLDGSARTSSLSAINTSNVT